MRWFVVTTAFLLAVALALYPLTLVDAPAHVLIPGGGAVVLFAAAAAMGLWRCAGAGALLIVAEYSLALIARDSGIDAAAIAVGVALFIELELVDIAVQASRQTFVTRAVLVNRLRFGLVGGLAGIGGGAAALVTGVLAVGGHPLSFLAGAAAAVAAVGIGVTLARRAVLGP